MSLTNTTITLQSPIDRRIRSKRMNHDLDHTIRDKAKMVVGALKMRSNSQYRDYLLSKTSFDHANEDVHGDAHLIYQLAESEGIEFNEALAILNS